jgi:8-oxo-dGTP pyrophosphatase MutT (NUDIX family)
MAQNYRIYINDKAIIITESAPEISADTDQIGTQGFDFAKTYYEVLNSAKHTFFIVTDDAKSFLKKMIKSVPLIEAAGGLVKNKKGEYLFIYRNDKWDLPKGKLEKGETVRMGAVREVEEECGIEIDESGAKICKTYHAYITKGQVVVKKSHWYKMKYKGKAKLVPQLEEGITEARWFDKKHTAEILQNTFPSIVEVMIVSKLIKDSQEQPLG